MAFLTSVRITAALLGIMALAKGAHAQSNLDFELPLEKGKALPPNWGIGPHQSHYSVFLDSSQAFSGRHSLTIRSKGKPDDAEFGTIMQSFDAAPYRGKQVLYHVWARSAPKDSLGAHIWMRVDRQHNQSGFFSTKADKDIRSKQWDEYQILGYVAPDAERIVVGAYLTGEGEMGIDSVEVRPMDGGKIAPDGLPEFLTIETPGQTFARLAVSSISYVKLNPDNMVIILSAAAGQYLAFGDYEWFAKPFLLR